MPFWPLKIVATILLHQEILQCLKSAGQQVRSIQFQYSNVQNALSADIVFPNPFDNQINFVLDSEFVGGIAYIQLFDTFGRLVVQQIEELENEGEQKLHINTESLPKGIYFYRFIIDDNLIISGKVTK